MFLRYHIFLFKHTATTEIYTRKDTLSLHDALPISHALQVVNGPGVVNFQNDVVGNWGTLFGTGTRSFGPVAGYAYTVSAAADPADVVNAGRFVATATGLEGARNVGGARHPLEHPGHRARGHLPLAGR